MNNSLDKRTRNLSLQALIDTFQECKFSKRECYLQAPSMGGRFAPMKMFDDVPFMQGAKCPKGVCILPPPTGYWSTLPSLKDVFESLVPTREQVSNDENQHAFRATGT
jgi:hypothetical protein